MRSNPNLIVTPDLEEATDRVLEKVDSLPTLPAVALRVGELVNNP